MSSISDIIPIPQQERRWGVGTGVLVWLASVVSIFGFQLVALVVYFLIKGVRVEDLPKGLETDWLIVMLSIASTFPAHILTLLLCRLVVTSSGQRPFLQSMGWNWHPQFKWVHAVALAFLMYAVALMLENLLPHRETSVEKLLKMGMSVRVMVASLAVLTAPLVEEVVYRGVLYSGIERAWGKAAGVILVTALFALVHVPQYWGSYAAIGSIVALSLVLTLLRATTGQLLPCVATHLVYNGIQSLLVLAAPEEMLEGESARAALAVVCRSLGMN